MTVGSRGAAVLKLERELKERGLLRGPVDNVFDARTAEAVKKYERKSGFKVDGVVGQRIADRFDLPGASQKPDGEGIFDVVSMNVKSNPIMRPGQMQHDVRKAARMGDIIGWQEISPANYRAEIRKQKGFDTFMPKGLQTPISWRTSEFELLDSGVERMHGGRAGVSPHRQVAWVKLQNKETGEVMVHMNTHLVSGAWNSKKQPTDPWRQKMWKQHIEKMGNLIERFEKKGVPVTITGDFNRNHFRMFGDEVKYDSGIRAGTHGRSTLDYVMSTRHAELSKVNTRVDRGFESDHNAVVVRYDLD
ncbi:MAG: peptidoglycan-binding protein [Myxococcaceae bacterium]|nr:peptidoglycan-binding protein [Myxococcaceae bacterium]